MQDRRDTCCLLFKLYMSGFKFTGFVKFSLANLRARIRGFECVLKIYPPGPLNPGPLESYAFERYDFDLQPLSTEIVSTAFKFPIASLQYIRYFRLPVSVILSFQTGDSLRRSV